MLNTLQNISFGTPFKAINAYGADPSAGGWESFDLYPRQVADVNGDGKADIIGFAADATYVSLGKANGTFATPLLATGIYSVNSSWSSFDLYPRQVADVNGDGKADVIGFAADGVIVSLGKANGTFGTPFVAINTYGVNNNWTSFDLYPRQVADVNGDGKADIIGFADDGTYVSLGQANGTFSNPFKANDNFGIDLFAGNWNSFDERPRQVADINGDGRADIVGRLKNTLNTFIVVESLGGLNGNFGPSFVASTTHIDNSFQLLLFDKSPYQVADFNGDGKADIIAFDDPGTYISLGQEDGTFVEPFPAINEYGTFQGWTSFDKYPREVADVNGDGKADIIGFSSTGVYVSLAKSSSPTISIKNITVTEGNSSNKIASFTVTLSKSDSKPVTVKYFTANGTAIGGSDYLATSGILSFSPGQITKNVSVSIKGDLTVEKNETFFVNLSGASNATIASPKGIGTIKNDDFPNISINNVTLTEGNSGTKNAAFTVTLSDTNFGDPVKVSYRTVDGSAKAVSDYLPKSGVLTFNPGQKTQTISIPVRGDIIPEPQEKFVVQLYSPQNGKLSQAQGTGFINNDDFLTQAKSLKPALEYDRDLILKHRGSLNLQKAANLIQIYNNGINANDETTLTLTQDKLLAMIIPPTT